MSKEWRWYVEPKGEFTNEVIARMLSATGDVADSWEMNLVDPRGRTFNAWRVSYTIVNQLKSVRGASFQLFARQGTGLIRDWKFPNRGKSKKVTEIESQLETLKRRSEDEADRN